ncbi:tyrosine--tRNA ligase [bacterium]|nr:tyrosine--tRNA ligase [bacterium]
MTLSKEATSKVEDVFGRGVEKVFDPANLFRKKLEAKASGRYKKDIIIKFGVDPTRPDIHLGHAHIFRKLRILQDLGCKVVFLVGDFTARIGDPTGKSDTRPEVDQKQVESNMKTYEEQVGKILLTKKEVYSWIRNSDWFTNITDLQLPEDAKIEMTATHKGERVHIPIKPNSFIGKAIIFEETRMQVKNLGITSGISVVTTMGLLWTLKHITFNRLIKRDMFQARIKEGRELYMHELLYPVFQAIDSHVIESIYGSCDLEIGGSDQTFNMLLGRDVQEVNKKTRSPRETKSDLQAVLSLKLLVGTDGKEKMSKSLNNYIGINENPALMYGKIMSIPDSSIMDYFELCTYTPLEEIDEIRKRVMGGKENPRDIKMRLAREIVAIYHGEGLAARAEDDFVRTFRGGGIPADIKEIVADKGTRLSDILIKNKLVSSRSDFRRLFERGALKYIKEEGIKEKIINIDTTINETVTVQVGKNRFIKIHPV